MQITNHSANHPQHQIAEQSTLRKWMGLLPEHILFAPWNANVSREFFFLLVIKITRNYNIQLKTPVVNHFFKSTQFKENNNNQVYDMKHS